MMMIDSGSDLHTQWATANKIDLNSITAYLDERDTFEVLQGILDSSRRVSKIVRNILGFSQGQSARHMSTDLGEVIDKALEFFFHEYHLRKQEAPKDIQILRYYAPDLQNIMCSVAEIQHVIINLLSNAAQPMESQTSTDKPKITLRTKQKGRWACIEVEDDGPGMPLTVKDRIFEPFFTTKEVDEGTGIGLFLVHYIITKNHHGTIEVDSKPGQGTRFSIRLPFEPTG